MSKYDYLHALYQSLKSLSREKRNKIMREVEDRFRHAEENNEDESIVTKALGSPRDYAKQFIDQDIVLEYNPDDITMDSLTSNETIITKAPNLIDGLELATDEFTHTDDEPKQTLDETAHIDEPQTTEVMTKELAEETISTLAPTHYDKPKTEIKKVYTSPQALPRKKANHPVKMLGISLLMVLFNAVFALGPFIAIWTIIVAFVASGIAITISGVLVLVSAALSLPLSFVSVPLVFLSHPVLLFCFGFLLTGIGGLLTVATIYSIRFFGYLTFKYFGWNLSVIRGY